MGSRSTLDPAGHWKIPTEHRHSHAAFTKRVQEQCPVGQNAKRKNGQGASTCLPILRWARSQHSTRPDTQGTRPPPQTPSALRWRRTSSITETFSPRCPPLKLTTVAEICSATDLMPSAPPKKQSYSTQKKKHNIRDRQDGRDLHILQIQT